MAYALLKLAILLIVPDCLSTKSAGSVFRAVIFTMQHVLTTLLEKHLTVKGNYLRFLASTIKTKRKARALYFLHVGQ